MRKLWITLVWSLLFLVAVAQTQAIQAPKSMRRGGRGSRVPHINSLQPTSGPVGVSVTITGNGFTLRGNKVKFGELGSENNPSYSLNSPDGKTIVFVVPSSDFFACWSFTLACKVPATMTQPGTYSVSVINANGMSNALTFMVTIPPPTHGDFQPTTNYPFSVVGYDADPNDFVASFDHYAFSATDFYAPPVERVDAVLDAIVKATGHCVKPLNDYRDIQFGGSPCIQIVHNVQFYSQLLTVLFPPFYNPVPFYSVMAAAGQIIQFFIVSLLVRFVRPSLQPPVRLW